MVVSHARAIPITYFGVLRAPTSWAKVGREMNRALIDNGADLNIFERKGFLFDPNMRLPQPIEERITNSFRRDVVYTFEHPATYRYLRGSLKVGLLTYESTVVPRLWVENVCRFLDLLLLPSAFCYDLFIRAGVPSQMCAVLPYGYRPDIYYKKWCFSLSDQDTSFQFLSVSSPHKREGLDVLLNAYGVAFSEVDNVLLTIKLNYLPNAKGKAFEQVSLGKIIDSYRAQRNYPQVELISDFYSEEEMAQLYRKANCFVSATRGEGFGMAFLEALACGLPIIVTGWGGHLDFLTSESAWLIKYKLKRAKEAQYDCQDMNALIAEPDLNDLVKKMRLVYQEQRREGLLIPADQKVPLEYSWTRIAKRFIELISFAQSNSDVRRLT